MDFSLSQEQQQLRELAHEFAKNEIRPASAHHDQTGEFPTKVLKKAWELGLMNTIPEAYGMGLGVTEGVLMGVKRPGDVRAFRSWRPTPWLRRR